MKINKSFFREELTIKIRPPSKELRHRTRICSSKKNLIENKNPLGIEEPSLSISLESGRNDVHQIK